MVDVWAYIRGFLSKSKYADLMKLHEIKNRASEKVRFYDILHGAADRGRTGTDFTPRDFKSLVSAYSTTAA